MTGTQTARGLAVALAVTIGVLLLADLAVVAARVGPSGSEVDDDPRPLEAVLPELITFVEQARGLRFRTPPDVRLLADDEFDAQLTEGDPTDADEQAADDAAYLGLLRALGLIEGGVDLDQLAADTVASIVGFYDTDSKVLYARGASATPYVKEVLVHELTHALDDQHFGIEGADLVDDVAAAFDALVEGSATAVEDRWFDARPAAEQDEITREDGVGTVRGDDVFTALFGFPYVAGPAFVESLLDAGGTARLDDAFRRPPRSTEQILHPDRYLAGDAP
ncbi:MAG: hypothetical protein ACRD12_19735, partial [Acidimicrobiales bacterium]